MVLMLSLQLLNPAFHQRRHQARSTPQDRYENYHRMTDEFLPLAQDRAGGAAVAAAGACRSSARGVRRGTARPALGSLSLLGLYALAAGAVLAGRLRGEFHGENLARAPRRKKAVPGQSNASTGRASLAARASRGWSAGSGPIAALIEKDLRNLLRTLPLLWALGIPVFGSPRCKRLSQRRIRGGQFLPVCAAALRGLCTAGLYAVFLQQSRRRGSGDSVAVFFRRRRSGPCCWPRSLSMPRSFGLDAVLAAILTTLRLGPARRRSWWQPRRHGCCLPALQSGRQANILSITMPYRVNPGRISRQRGSQANALIRPAD